MVNSPFPQWFQQGAYFGSQPPNSTASPSNAVVTNGLTVNGDGGMQVNGAAQSVVAFVGTPTAAAVANITGIPGNLVLTGGQDQLTFITPTAPANERIYTINPASGGGAIEFNTIRDDFSNPQTFCNMDPYNFIGGADFSCVGTISGGALTSPQIRVTNGNGGPWLILSAGTLPACGNNATVPEGTITIDNSAGGTSGHRTRLCFCTSNGAGTPAYAWVNAVTGTVGTSTTCSD